MRWAMYLMLCLAATLGAATVRADPLLWEVRDAEGALRGHLFGTVHLCNEACYPLPPDVIEAFAGSAALALELDPADDTMGPSLAAAGSLPPGQQLDGLLPEDLRPTLALAIERSGADGTAIRAMRPWLASMVLMVAAAERAGYGARWGVDLWLAREARATDRPLIALETVERQIAALSAGGDATQLEALGQMLRLVRDDGVGPFLERVRAAWQQGDGDSLLGMIDEGGDESLLEPLIDDLVDARNLEMAHHVGELLSRGPRLFVAVGAAHFGGPRSLVARLAAMGFALRRIGAAAIAGEAEPGAGAGAVSAVR